MLNISVDTLRPERFEQMTRRRGHERVMDAIHHAIRLGYDPVKVCSCRCVHEMMSQPFWDDDHPLQSTMCQYCGATASLNFP